MNSVYKRPAQSSLLLSVTQNDKSFFIKTTLHVSVCVFIFDSSKEKSPVHLCLFEICWLCLMVSDEGQ